jgi:uncharacterized RDD family membrane protein YckC
VTDPKSYPRSDGFTGIVTPEAVVLDLEPATVGSRVCAFVLDVTVQGMLYGVLALLWFPISFIAPEWLGIAYLIVALFGVIFVYPALSETMLRGQTLGKMATGLRVVTIEGAPVRFRHASIRAFLALVEIWACFGSIAALTMLLTPRAQRLGDLAAGTQVVRERNAGAHVRPIDFAVPFGYEQVVAALDPSGLSAQDYHEIRRVLLRVFELTPTARLSICHRMAVHYQGTLGHTVHHMVTPEAYLLCLMAAYQQHHDIGPPRAMFLSAAQPVA